MGCFELAFYGWREGAGHKFFGPNNALDLWHVKKVNPQSMIHLTEKPVELAVRAMQYSSRTGDNVLDLFGGSGSTMIAAQQTGRKAYLMELDTLYCDVIVEPLTRSSPARRRNARNAAAAWRRDTYAFSRSGFTRGGLCRTTLKDSGTRQEFATGAVRDQQVGKGRFDLLPPRALLRLAKHFEKGAAKYGDRNWEQGMPMSRYVDSALRHAFAFLRGQKDEDHLVAAAWNLLAALETEWRAMEYELPRELLDIGPNHREEDA